MHRNRDRYGAKPGKLASLMALVIWLVVMSLMLLGLFYALVNWPLTLIWAALMIVLAFGALFGGLPTAIGDVWFAWTVRQDEGQEDNDKIG